VAYDCQPNAVCWAASRTIPSVVSSLSDGLCSQRKVTGVFPTAVEQRVHITQSILHSSLGFQVKVLHTFKGVAFLRGGATQPLRLRARACWRATLSHRAVRVDTPIPASSQSRHSGGCYAVGNTVGCYRTPELSSRRKFRGC